MKIILTSTLNSEGEALRIYAENILKDINELSSLNDSILSFWDGNDAKVIVKKINEEVIPTLNKFYDYLIDYADFLKKVNSVFKAVESEYNKKIDI